MALPFFYNAAITTGSSGITLNEETSRHVVQVLRMKNGEALRLTDGIGHLYIAVITDDNRKRCAVKIEQQQEIPAPANKVSIAISLVKNNSRFEWFLEKAAEIGVSEIIPMICERTEKQQFRSARMKGILISAMLQSQQCWLPVLHIPEKFSAVVGKTFNGQQFIAHCEEEAAKKEINSLIKKDKSKIILIGPEGDFTNEEIALAFQNKFVPVALGNTRLRTETAGIVAATMLCNA